MKSPPLKEIIDQSLGFAAAENYAGYDPYDALNTSFGMLKKGKWPPVLFIQVMKRLPVNLRPILGIKKGHNPKGIGLLLESCAILNRLHPREYDEHINRLLALLDELKTPGYSGTCWGYNFDWASPVKTLPKYSPTVVVTGFISKALFGLIQHAKNERAERLFRNIEPFIAEDLPAFSDETGLCISYSTVKRDCCFNASLLAAGYYARLFHLTKNPEHRSRAKDLVDFVIHRQKKDGSWAYSIDLETGNERIQTDFHQGFILDCIMETMEFLNEQPDHWLAALHRGASFYFHQQFDENGRSFFRLPKKYPTDVHHQAQGIITAAKIARFFPEFVPDGDKMVNWALKHMHDGNGRFYYRVFAGFTDKTRYLRWGQAWMTLALSHWFELKSAREKS